MPVFLPRLYAWLNDWLFSDSDPRDVADWTWQWGRLRRSPRGRTWRPLLTPLCPFRRKSCTPAGGRSLSTRTEPRWAHIASRSRCHSVVKRLKYCIGTFILCYLRSVFDVIFLEEKIRVVLLGTIFPFCICQDKNIEIRQSLYLTNRKKHHICISLGSWYRTKVILIQAVSE